MQSPECCARAPNSGSLVVCMADSSLQTWSGRNSASSGVASSAAVADADPKQHNGPEVLDIRLDCLLTLC